jgi:hypothetical protein
MGIFRKWHLTRLEQFEILKEIILTIVISSLVSFAISSYLNKTQDQRVAARQFINSFSRTFFDTPKYRDLSVALEANYLYPDAVKFKRIDRDRFGLNGKIFTEYQLDDYLSLLGDIYSFYTDGFVSKELLDRQYAYYVCVAYNDKVVKDYRAELLLDGFSKNLNYSYLDDLAGLLGVKNKDCKKL